MAQHAVGTDGHHEDFSSGAELSKLDQGLLQVDDERAVIADESDDQGAPSKTRTRDGLAGYHVRK
jgi:hypothetical protein